MSLREAIRHEAVRIVIIIILILGLSFGFCKYFELKRQADQELQGYVERLSDEGFVLMERALTDLDKINASGIPSFNEFLSFGKEENVSQIYRDKLERVLYFWNPSVGERTEIVQFYIVGSPFDLGGVWTLVLTALIIMLSKFDKWIIEELKTCEPERRALISIPMATGLIGLWLTVRTIVLNLIQYISVEGFPYSPSDIFLILSFFVTANLSFTLVKALRIGGKQDETIKGLVDVVIQVIMVSLITFIPSYGRGEFLSAIGGSTGFVSIFISMIIALLIMVFVRKNLIHSRTKEE